MGSESYAKGSEILKFSIIRPYPISLWPCPASLNSHRAPSRARLLGWCQLQGTMGSACVQNSYKLILYTEFCSDASSPKSHCLFFYFSLLISFPGIWSVLSPPHWQQQTQPGNSRPLPTVIDWVSQAAAQGSLNMDWQEVFQPVLKLE